MTGRTLPDDCRYPPASDAQIEEMQDRIAEYSAGDKTIATRIDWLGSFRRLLPMYWKYKQDAEYWKSWQDPDKIKNLEAENAGLLAIAQGQREELAKPVNLHQFREHRDALDRLGYLEKENERLTKERDHYRGELAVAESQNRLEG